MKPTLAGAVVRRTRLAQGLTLAQLGQRIGYSASQLSRLERGLTPLSDVDLLHRVAIALSIPAQLLGVLPLETATPAANPPRIDVRGPTVGHQRGEDGDDPVRRRELLSRMTGLSGAALLAPETSFSGRLEHLLLDSAPAQPVSLAGLRHRVSTAHTAYAECRYGELAAALPAMAGAARAGRDGSEGRAREQYSALLSQLYQLTSHLCVKAGEDAMSWVAADRARTAGRASGDPIMYAEASRTVAIAMRRQGHYGGATSLLTQTALSLGADQGDPPPEFLAGYGSLLLTAAYACAQHGDQRQALELLHEAAEAAGRLGRHRVPGSDFSASNVSIYAIGVHHALGDSAAALDAARRVDQHRLPSRERHARFCVDTARAWVSHGRTDRACQALVAAERRAPEEVRRPSVCRLIAAMLDVPGQSPAGLRALAARAGVAR